MEWAQMKAMQQSLKPKQQQPPMMMQAPMMPMQQQMMPMMPQAPMMMPPQTPPQNFPGMMMNPPPQVPQMPGLGVPTPQAGPGPHVVYLQAPAGSGSGNRESSRQKKETKDEKKKRKQKERKERQRKSKDNRSSSEEKSSDESDSEEGEPSPKVTKREKAMQKEIRTLRDERATSKQEAAANMVLSQSKNVQSVQAILNGQQTGPQQGLGQNAMVGVGGVTAQGSTQPLAMQQPGTGPQPIVIPQGNMILMQQADGTMAVMQGPGVQAAPGVVTAGGGLPAAGAQMLMAGQQQPGQPGSAGPPPAAGVNAAGTATDTKAKYKSDVKLKLDDFRTMMVDMVPEGEKQEDTQDALRQAQTKEDIVQIMVKMVKRDQLMQLALDCGTELSTYEQARSTRGLIMSALVAARLQ
jgi:hypothetical protein